MNKELTTLTDSQEQALHRLFYEQKVRLDEWTSDNDPAAWKRVKALNNLEDYIRQSDSDTIGDDVESLMEHMILVWAMIDDKEDI